jgi:hypothetical protein
MKFRPFTIFYILTFLLLGLIPLFSALLNDGSMNFDDAARRASQETGLEWTSNLIVVLRLSMVEPILILTLLGSAVPAIAAILILLYLRDGTRWKRFLDRLKPYRKTPGLNAAGLYGSIFLILVPCLFAVLLIRQATGGDYVGSVTSVSLTLIPALLAIAFLDQGAVLEELGWRGFATPELQDAGVTPLKVAIIVGICWGLWHLPRDITTGVIERLGVSSYLALYLPSFVLGTISVSVIASYFMNRLGGSVIPAIVVHGITNDAVGLSGTASIVEALTPYHQITKNLPLALIAVALVIYSGWSLGLNHVSSGHEKGT